MNRNMNVIMDSCPSQSKFLSKVASCSSKDVFEVLYDYKVVGEKLDTLIRLCENKIDLFVSTIIEISNVDAISIDAVHANLSRENPIPFVEKVYNPAKLSMEAYCYTEYYKYNKRVHEYYENLTNEYFKNPNRRKGKTK